MMMPVHLTLSCLNRWDGLQDEKANTSRVDNHSAIENTSTSTASGSQWLEPIVCQTPPWPTSQPTAQRPSSSDAPPCKVIKAPFPALLFHDPCARNSPNNVKPIVHLSKLFFGQDLRRLSLGFDCTCRSTCHLVGEALSTVKKVRRRPLG